MVTELKFYHRVIRCIPVVKCILGNSRNRHAQSPVLRLRPPKPPPGPWTWPDHHLFPGMKRSLGECTKLNRILELDVEAQLVRLEISPALALAPTGLSLQFRATGVFNDNSRSDLIRHQTGISYINSSPDRSS